ncbi:uncharacterized protein GGS25DRAFT_418125 [Hypoxylon fragiforme]|uniref:uncharacterized protein n=1 Tax=Hypoxylon fragiforme TaxID=63214 RepID=UPI0020C6AB90|nr:uncharacterized protein GGS25DRAFT_418125 [Hypoxylon fragiforme]KAI2605154.1 hypothetical protein GGS25DRAFT_418125 [Hypoxylon fragiforme]
MPVSHLHHFHSNSECHVNHCSLPTTTHPSPIIDMSGTAPGKRCPTCEGKGKEVWVLPGRDCPYCGTYVS